MRKWLGAALLVTLTAACQDRPGTNPPAGGTGGGTTVERERTEPLTDGVATSTRGACGVGATFSVLIEHNGRAIGLASAPPNDAATVTEAVVLEGHNASGRVELLGGKMATYAGTADVQWTYDGNAAGPGPFRASGKDAPALEDDIKRVNRLWVNNGWSFAFPAPPTLGSVHPDISKNASATATWTPADKTVGPCSVTRNFRIHWLHAERPRGFSVPALSTNPARDTLALSTGPLVYESPHSTSPVSVVQPLLYYWGVADPKTCCGKKCRHYVVQFARASIESADPRFQKGKDWTVDIPESEKAKAAAGASYDPTFTNAPGVGNTQLGATGSAGNASLGQFDAPGMTEELYDQLRTAAGRHVFRQQFASFLVCDPGNPAPHDSRSFLGRASVVKAVLFTVEWIFDNGPGGAPTTPAIRGIVASQLDMHCKNLRDVLDKNGFLGPYGHPIPAQLTPMKPADAAAHDAELQHPPALQAP